MNTEQDIATPPQAVDAERERIARILADKLWCGATFDDGTESEREAFLGAAAAVLDATRPSPALAVVEAWLPISTAPKDGMEVLLWLCGPWSRIEKAHWYKPWGNWICGADPSDPNREDRFGIGCLIPTHWMPLPAPPISCIDHEGSQS
jgi:hypothetical protein